MKRNRLGIALVTFFYLSTLGLQIFWIDKDMALKVDTPLVYIVTYDLMVIAAGLFALPVAQVWGGFKTDLGKALMFMILPEAAQVLAFTHRSLVNGGLPPFSLFSQAMYAAMFMFLGVAGAYFFKALSDKASFYKMWFWFFGVGTVIGVGFLVYGAVFAEPPVSIWAFNVAWMTAAIVPAVEGLCAAYFAKKLSKSVMYAPMLIFGVAMLLNGIGNTLSLVRDASSYPQYNAFEQFFFISFRYLWVLSPIVLGAPELQADGVGGADAEN